MFKLVVLCAFLAAAAANPGLIAPLAYSSNYVAPLSAYSYYPGGLNNLVYSSPVVSSPLAYSAPLTHLIKKRSAPLLNTYIAGSPYTTAYSTPFLSSYAGVSPLATTYSTGLHAAYGAPLYTTGHLIKKRSAQFVLPSTYVSPSSYVASSPLYTSTYSAASPIISSPFLTTGPYGYTVPLIKK